VVYNVAANAESAARTGTIVVSGGGITRTFTVTQDGAAGGGSTLGEAVDAPQLTWATGGSANWYYQTSDTRDGVDAAQSGRITHNQQTWMQATVTGPGTLSFWWSVSSESRYDYLRFLIDGVEQRGSISGSVSWQQKTYTIPSGTHTLRWMYTKDQSVSSGSDCGRVDQVAWTPSSASGRSVAKAVWPKAWAKSGDGAWEEAPELVDGDEETFWEGDPAATTWSVALDFGRSRTLHGVEIFCADEAWADVGMIGSADLVEWFDLDLISEWPVSCRALYLHFRQDGTGTAPSILGIRWEEDPHASGAP